ncbi:MAG: methionyl-tRNA formyltransferase, partial [Candidatus Sulfotelmatobacter sp.]
GKTLQITKARPATDAVPQAELRLIADRLLAGCGHNTSLELLELQMEGKKRSPARDFLHGYRPQPGERLG